jgi:DhnA family fructose-bisphosphate aldolase class Ia
LDRGARIVAVRPGPVFTAEGWKSPADPAFDPFWARVAEARLVVACHPGFDDGYRDVENAVARSWGYESRRLQGPVSSLNFYEPIVGALEMDAACVVVNLFMLPDEPELFRQCVENISRVRADCHRYGMPLMIEPLVMLPNAVRGGYQVDGDTEKIVTLVRLASEMGADIIKADPTDDPEAFHRVVEAARVPVLVRGGGKEDLKAVLAKSATLMRQGARGMVYGRNIYQHANPNSVVSALMAIIHDSANGDEAWDVYSRG